MRVAIACGGTGGHLFPGLAVAEQLADQGHEVLLFVSEKEIDTQALKTHPEFRAERLPSIGMPSLLSPAMVGFARRMWESLSRCREIYRRNKPGAILGMGGFTSIAPLLAGRWEGIPTFVHESNAIPGRANKLAARFTTGVLLGFEGCKQHFPGRETVVTGTPIRSSMMSAISREDALKAFNLDPARKTLLVMGGSQGAAGINQLLFKSAPLLKNEGVQIIHLTGDRDEKLAAANYLREEIPSYVAPFHHRMEEAYVAADLAVSRAGAASISELSWFGLASIMIPFPYATDNHQEANARILEREGATILVRENEANAEILARIIQALLSDEQRRLSISDAARNLAPRDAASRIAALLEASAK